MNYLSNKLTWNIKPYYPDMFYDIYRKINNEEFVLIKDNVSDRYYIDEDISERGIYKYLIKAKLSGEVVAESIQYRFFLPFNVNGDDTGFITNKTPNFVADYDPDPDGIYRAKFNAQNDYFAFDLVTAGLSNLHLSLAMRREYWLEEDEYWDDVAGCRDWKLYYNIGASDVAITEDTYDFVLGVEEGTTKKSAWMSKSFILPEACNDKESVTIIVKVARITGGAYNDPGGVFNPYNEIKDVAVHSESKSQNLGMQHLTGDDTYIYASTGSEKKIIKINKQTYERNIFDTILNTRRMIIEGNYLYYTNQGSPNSTISKLNLSDLSFVASQEVAKELVGNIVYLSNKIFGISQSVDGSMIVFNDINDLSDTTLVPQPSTLTYAMSLAPCFLTNEVFAIIYHLGQTYKLYKCGINDEEWTHVHDGITGSPITGVLAINNNILYAILGDIGVDVVLHVFDVNNIQDPSEGAGTLHLFTTSEGSLQYPKSTVYSENHLYFLAQENNTLFTCLVKVDISDYSYQVLNFGSNLFDIDSLNCFGDHLYILKTTDSVKKDLVIINKHDLQYRIFNKYFENQQ